MFVGRGKNKVFVDYGIKDIYKYYQDNAQHPLSHKQFKKVWLDMIKIITDLIVYKNLEFSIPSRLGSLGIRKIKSKAIIKEDGTVLKNRLSRNYKACWEKWTRDYPDKTPMEIAKIKNKRYIYYLNEHSDGYKVKWKWDKYTTTVKNQAYYSLAVLRDHKKKLSDAFINHKTDYYEYKFK